MKTNGDSLVFLTYSFVDRKLASGVAKSLSDAHIRVFDAIQQPRHGGDPEAQMHQAIETCTAVIVVLSEVANQHQIPTNILFEIGAASQAGKPIHVLLKNVGGLLPFHVTGLKVWPLNGVDALVDSLRSIPVG